MSETDDSRLNIVNSSGFPFQVRIAHEIQSAQRKWSILAQEHRWANPQSGDEGFIDLILEHVNLRLILECKRVSQAQWVFLMPGLPRMENRVRLLHTRCQPGVHSLPEWQDWACEPNSYETPFCVVRGHSEKDKPMLERLAGVVLESVESFANEEAKIFENAKDGTTYRLMYAAAIVTTANLDICQFHPKDVDIQEGIIPEKVGQFQPVSFVRFRKGLATHIISSSPATSVEKANLANERTVFVIQATHLVDFLQQFQLLAR